MACTSKIDTREQAPGVSSEGTSCAGSGQAWLKPTGKGLQSGILMTQMRSDESEAAKGRGGAACVVLHRCTISPPLHIVVIICISISIINHKTFRK